MSVFYFHVRWGDVIYLDHEGVALLDLRAAWDHAREDARELFRLSRDDVTTERWIEIDDGRGHLVATAPAGATFH